MPASQTCATDELGTQAGFHAPVTLVRVRVCACGSRVRTLRTDALDQLRQRAHPDAIRVFVQVR